MILFCAVLLTVSVATTLGGIHLTFRALGLDLRWTLFWFGLAELPAEKVPPRQRPGGGQRTSDRPRPRARSAASRPRRRAVSSRP